MKLRVALILWATLILAPLRSGSAQNISTEIDLLYPEFAHPQQDVAAAIQRDDLRLLAVDRARKKVPGMEHAKKLIRRYGVKYIRQRFRLFPSRSENFSFNLRARAYAEEYNVTLAHFLLAHPDKK